MRIVRMAQSFALVANFAATALALATGVVLTLPNTRQSASIVSLVVAITILAAAFESYIA